MASIALRLKSDPKAIILKTPSSHFFSSGLSSSFPPPSEPGQTQNDESTQSNGSENARGNKTLFSSYSSDLKSSLKPTRDAQPSPQGLFSNKPSPFNQPPKSFDEALSEFRRQYTPPPPPVGGQSQSRPQPIGISELIRRVGGAANESRETTRPSMYDIRESFHRQLMNELSSYVAKGQVRPNWVAGLRGNNGVFGVSNENLPENVFEKEIREREDKRIDGFPQTEFMRSDGYEGLGEKLRKLRLAEGGKKQGSRDEPVSFLAEMEEMTVRLREMLQNQPGSKDKRIFEGLKESTAQIAYSEAEAIRKRTVQRVDVLGHLGGTPSSMLEPPKEHLVEKMTSVQRKTRRKGKEEADGGNVCWDNEKTTLLIRLMANHCQISLGKNGEVVNRKVKWEKVATDFNRISGMAWSHNNFKSKRDMLRGQWKDWKRLKKDTTGFGFDNDLWTIDAPDEWWAMKIVEDSSFQRFRTRGFSPEEEDHLQLIFGDGEAKGTRKFCPSSSHPTSDAGDADGSLDGYRPAIHTDSQDGSQSFANQIGAINIEDDFIPMDEYQATDSPTPTSTPAGLTRSSRLGKRSSESDDSSDCKRMKKLTKEREARQLDAIAEGLLATRAGIDQSNKLLASIAEQSLARSKGNWDENDAVAALLDMPEMVDDPSLLSDAIACMRDESNRRLFKTTLQLAGHEVAMGFINSVVRKFRSSTS